MDYSALLIVRPLFWVTGGWICLAIMAGILIGLALKSRHSGWLQLGGLLVMGAYLFIRRYPVLHQNSELNPDESQILAQALTLWYHAIYWRFVDGATMGPLSSYLMASPALFGLPLDYLIARWLGFGCTLFTLGATYMALVNLFDRKVALPALLPLVVFTGYTQYADFVHNTNEQLSLLLIGVCLWQFSHIVRHGLFGRPRLLFMLSFTASLVPFAKLQGTPLALVIILAALLSLFRQRTRFPAPLFRQSLLGLLAGGVAFPIVFVGLTVYFGVFNDFSQFYLVSNATYGSGESFWTNASQFITLVGRADDFIRFLIPTIGLLIAWLLWSERRIVHPNLLLFCLAFLLVGLYSIVKPGNMFSHYLLYLIVPVTLVNAYLISLIRLPMMKVSLSIIVLVYLPFLVNDGLLRYKHQSFSPYLLYNQQMDLSGVAKETLKYAQPGEDLVVWGWMPRYNVQTQMPQGVADNHVIHCVFGTPSMIRLHRNRYIQNISRSKPPVFIDAVGENCVWLTDRSRFSHEVFPELNAYVSKYYRYVGEIEHTRIYVRNDRYALLSGKSSDTHASRKRLTHPEKANPPG